jgi:hypothetical protein
VSHALGPLIAAGRLQPAKIREILRKTQDATIENGIVRARQSHHLNPRGPKPNEISCIELHDPDKPLRFLRK